jgi:hypothetical protein
MTRASVYVAVGWIFLLLSLTCDKGVDPGDKVDFPLIPESPMSGMSDSTYILYREDSYSLADRYLLQIKSTSVEIPSSLSATLLNGLLRIYNLQSLPERDTIVQLYPIHVSGYKYALYEVIVIVDPTRQWTQKWKNRERLTGNPEVDLLVQRYDLFVQDYIVSSWGSELAVLRSSRALHIQQLAECFKKIDGVTTAECNGSAGSGNDVLAEPESNAWKYTFVLGWGDCPSGCIFRRMWDFRVFTDGRVEFLGSRGDTVPPNGPRG